MSIQSIKILWFCSNLSSQKSSREQTVTSQYYNFSYISVHKYAGYIIYSVVIFPIGKSNCSSRKVANIQKALNFQILLHKTVTLENISKCNCSYQNLIFASLRKFVGMSQILNFKILYASQQIFNMCCIAIMQQHFEVFSSISIILHLKCLFQYLYQLQCDHLK